MYTLSKDNLEIIANTIRDELLKYNIKLDQVKAYDLLSSLIDNKPWPALSPALPKWLQKPDAERMAEWLTNQQKPIDQKDCEAILEQEFEGSPLVWCFRKDLNELEKDIAPLFAGFAMEGQNDNAVIVIDPDNKFVDVHSTNDENNLLRVSGREYAFQIPCDITGKALVEILTSVRFLNLLLNISQSWTLAWDGHNHKGALDDKVADEIIAFKEWLSSSDIQRAMAGTAEVYFEQSIRYYNKEGREVSYDTDVPDEINTISLDSINITASTTKEALIKKINTEISDQTLLIDLEDFAERLVDIVRDAPLSQTA